MKQSFLIFFAVSAAVAFAEKQPFERYQSIVDRQMFGVPPPGFDPLKMPSEVSKSSSRGQEELTKEQAKLQSSVHFSVINVAADGTPVVGFSDNSNPKAPVHHYLKVGEESGGWKVLSANPSESSMTIAKEGVELTLKLGDNSGKSASNGGKGSAAPAVASAGRRRSGLLGTLGSRRAQREKLRLEQQAAERKKLEEERLQQERREQEREQEREQNRQQLQALQESLRQLRESQNAARAAANEGETNEDDNAQ